jgi:hypothetical protein
LPPESSPALRRIAHLNLLPEQEPYTFHGPSAFSGNLAESVMFDLGVTAGTDVASLSYSASIDMDPLGAVPTGSFATAGVDNVSLLFGGVSDTDSETGTTFLGGSGGDAPPKAENFKGANAGESQGKDNHIAGKEADIAAIDEDKQGAIPGAVARSLAYLEAQNQNVIINDPAQKIYDDLKVLMGTTTGDGGTGTKINSLKPAKDIYTKTRKIPVDTKKVNTIHDVLDTLKANKTVEAVFKLKGKGGHVGLVSKIIPNTDKNGVAVSYTISVIDDSLQGDHLASNTKMDYTVALNGDVLSPGYVASVDSFFVETAVPEPSTLAALLAGGLCLLVLVARRRKLNA